jgi:hypothetical protein
MTSSVHAYHTDYIYAVMHHIYMLTHMAVTPLDLVKCNMQVCGLCWVAVDC